MSGKEVSLTLTADTSGLDGAIKKSIGNFHDLERVVLKSLGAYGSGLATLGNIASAALAASAAMAGVAKAAGDYGNAINKQRQQTGLAADELSRLNYAAKASETDSAALTKGIGFLAKEMVGAAAGAQESSKRFDKLGVSLRNQDGTMRSTGEVLLDLADIFSVMPDGPEKAALSFELFGKKVGAELIPLLNQGRAGIKALGEEAESLGLVISNEAAEAADQFNDSLDRLGALSKGAAVSMGNVLIPIVNAFLQKLEDARRNKLSIGQVILEVLPDDQAPAAERLKAATEALKKLKAARDALGTYDLQTGETIDTSSEDAAIAKQAKLVTYLETLNKRIEGNDQDTAGKREQIARQLQRDLASLEQLRSIAAGKVNADILKDDKKRTAEQIANAEKLRDALQTAWETSRNEAAAAGKEATNLLDKAATTRTSTSDRAQQMRMAGLSDEEKQAINQGSAQDAYDQGKYYAAAAAAAQLDGRMKEFQNYSKQAEQFLARAMTFADQAGNPDLVENIGNSQAGYLEEQAKAKSAEAADLEQRATAQQEKIKELDGQLEQLKIKAAGIEVSADISQLQGAVASALAELDKLPSTKEITILVKKAAEVMIPQQSSESLPQFASGGLLRGPGSGTSDSILARLSNGEYIVKAAAVHHYGPQLLNRINSMQLPRFAEGGAVGRPVAAGSGSTVNLSLDGRTYRMSASDSVAAELVDAVRREALRKGRR